MIVAAERIIFILLSLTGLLVCCHGFIKGTFYRYGYRFFELLLLATVYRLVYSSFPQMLVEGLTESGLSLSQVARTVALAQFPGILLEILAFLFLVIGFYKYYKNFRTNR